MAPRCRTIAARVIALALVSGAVLVGSGAVAAPFADDFESDAPGTFPEGWVDVRLVALPNAPMPSATIVTTTDPVGAPTRALQTIDAAAVSRGAFRPIDAGTLHALSADVRVDRFGVGSPDAPDVSDWPLSIGVASLLPGSDLCCFPTAQVGLFVSAKTQGYRLYAIDGAGTASDIDLGLGATEGVWRHVDLDVDGATGAVRTRIVDPILGTVLLYDARVIPGWSPASFDVLAFLGGQLSAGGTAGIGSLDDVSWTPVPEPASVVLVAVGLTGLARARRR
ncbi:MAG: PEP-CTERM sorting domain-containing protein [Deltaproteobacteria bacterium]|nr:PEP-CTERM sorting domain-containing protein [Deltaproteobacteria bacterium]